MKIEVSDADIRERRAEYALALKIEKQASPTVREMWRKLVAMLDELLKRRAANRRKQFPGVAPVAPATDEPLDAVNVIAEYTSIPIEAVNRFLGALSMCGYDLVRQSSPKQLGELKAVAGGESQLEPCPFCGSSARWATTEGGDDSWEIQCSNQDCPCLFIGGGNTGEEVRKAWNTRAQPSPQRWIATSPEPGDEAAWYIRTLRSHAEVALAYLDDPMHIDAARKQLRELIEGELITPPQP